MELLFAVLPLAGCAAMSLLCHRMMTRRGGCASAPPDVEMAALRAELDDLRARRADARSRS